ncbi:DNA helicase protein [Dioscorea alata]|uniref:DNA helicase protein n=1 Tax=Dioscorea alata TaxID=55571 RepID=A0ACB7UY44_DIOAL|nr:DNA helicase protein [Dioscorea alata]
MWYDERIDISKSTSNPKFNMCCKQGIISLPPPKPTPPFLCRLFDEQIRIYNSLFQFTSLGGIVDNSINQRPGPYVFKLSGQNYHRMGSLLPFAGQTSKFAQLYMIESDAENILDEYNEIVKVFRSAREVHMQFRELPNNTLLRGGRLFQQFIVDCYAIIEDTRLRYIREHQTSLRTEIIGKRIILPANFIPGPRYMFEKYQDAMAICRCFGYPKLFITFTCNPRWLEITDTLSSILGQRPEDRPDIVSRVFCIKKSSFGPVKAVVYTVEFQKRGLPHVHILLWLEKESGIMIASEIDNIVSTELPDKRSDPIGYDAVSSFMIHGPCGLANSQAPCMENGKCKKFYPKAFRNSTMIDEDGFPQYRRRDLPASTSQNGIKLDNRFVVPHNVDLVVRYQAHINMEICNLTRAVKYLFKYISKGPDRARAMFEASSTSSAKTDEIQNYLNCRYLSAYESCWRLFEFPLHHREPSVQRLLIHLPEEHNIYFSDKQFIPNIISIPDFPTKFTWYKKEKKWKYRMNGRSIGRIIYIHPSARELYYLCLLLNENQREACFALGILGDDSEWSNALIQAAHWATGTQLRQLFVTIILYCDTFRMTNYTISDEYLRNYLLVALEELLNKHSSSLEDNDLPRPQSLNMNNLTDRLLQEELNYNIPQLQEDHLSMFAKLNVEQLAIYIQIQGAINNNGGMFFVYGHGGTGKTFLWNTIINGICTEGKIVLAVASSGIASLLLPGGRTAHSRFKIPINIEECLTHPFATYQCSTCKISKQTQLARLIEKTTLIVWDEAPMVHRNCLEALNKTLQDFLSETTPEASTKPFGGKTIVLGGDFRQILLVIQYGSKEDIINATITQSQLWKECKVLKLNTNMRLHRNNLDEESRDQLREFAEWLLQIGDAIVTPYNETVDILNETISNEIEADEQKYLSSDYISKASTSADANAPLYTTEFLNTLKFTGIPNHELTLKIGCDIMLIRNISQTNGLCNGTRLIITQMHHNILEVVIISGSNIGDKVYILRIIMPVQEGKWPFIMCQKQFPVKLSYAMTINKSQGQTLELVGLFLPKPVFSHGQLYVALSRVSSVEGLKVLILDDNGKNTNKTKNVVYKEIFDSIEINSDLGR